MKSRESTLSRAAASASSRGSSPRPNDTGSAAMGRPQRGALNENAPRQPMLCVLFQNKCHSHYPTIITASWYERLLTFSTSYTTVHYRLLPSHNHLIPNEFIMLFIQDDKKYMGKLCKFMQLYIDTVHIIQKICHFISLTVAILLSASCVREPTVVWRHCVLYR